MKTKHIVTSDGISLMNRTFSGETATKRVAFATHSQAQHTLSLQETLQGIADRGWTVHATDLRGHGHSSTSRAPLGHMDINGGWEKLVSDLHLALSNAFEGVAWENRLVVAPNIGTPLVLEVIKNWPDLARNIVMVTPPPNQPALLRLARSFVKVRSLFHPADKPDEVTLHQLYSFLGARISNKKRLIDVVSSDREITEALLADEYAWPTPTTGYFHEMFRGVQSGWTMPDGFKAKEGTSVLILYGGDDPITANGKFVQSMRQQLQAIGINSVDAKRVDGGRSGLFIEEKRFGISKIIDDWVKGEVAFNQEVDTGDWADISSNVLNRLGLEDVDRELSSEELVELCYTAIDDESRWVEILYRVGYAVSEGNEISDRELETIVSIIMPHWDRSYQLNRQIMQSAAIGAVLQNVMDRFDLGIAVVSEDMAVTYANRPFRKTISQITDTPYEVTEDLDQLSDLLARISSNDFLDRCQRDNGEALFMVDGVAFGFHFRPQALRQTALSRGGASGALILRGNDHEAAGVDGDKIELLQFAYGLTYKESEVALALLDGLSPDGISKRCGVTVNTTRTHLKRIYDKIGVQGQTELASLLLKGPMGLVVGR